MNRNRNSAYESRWAKFAEISRDSRTDSKKESIDRKYAPWVHAMFSLPHEMVEEAFPSSRRKTHWRRSRLRSSNRNEKLVALAREKRLSRVAFVCEKMGP